MKNYTEDILQLVLFVASVVANFMGLFTVGAIYSATLVLSVFIRRRG